MGKDKKKKKKPAPESTINEAENKKTETRENEQMTQEEERREEDTAGMKEEAEMQEDKTAEPDAAEGTEEDTEMPEDTEEEGGDPEEESEEDARDFFKKKKEKKEKKDELIADLTDKLQRQMAEFENFRKRTEKEKSAMFDMGSRNVIEKILPVIDNFERGLAGVPEERKEDPFVAGMDKVYKQLMKELSELGVKQIEALGQPFNPALHNAVMHMEDETVDENTIVEEFQKGYTFHDGVVRYSMVKVAN